MHTYFMTRGIKHSVDRFINELSAKYLPYAEKKQNKETGKIEDIKKLLQLRVCPIQLWDVSYAEENHEAILNTLFGSSCHGKPINNKHEKIAWVIRKALGVEPIPDKWDEKGKIPLFMENIEVVAIGTKKDYKNELGQEML